ncbi:MAG: adenylyl-sulfate kinase [Deltaproteobacteria bacterium]|nr:adenylyl-sulfate kinase [Deltaproteobacteria bacterium]
MTRIGARSGRRDAPGTTTVRGRRAAHGWRAAPPRGGRIVWITGLAGSGKTMVATAVVRGLGRARIAAVLLDGDALRRSIATDLGYDLADRRRAAERYARLARLLAAQGLTVVVATISMFESVRRANRRRAPHYFEVYLRLAAGCAPRVRGRGGATPVVGRELPFEAPVRPDLVVDGPLTRARAASVGACIVRSLVHGT